MAWGKERKGQYADSRVERLRFPLADSNAAAVLVKEDLPTRNDLIGYSLAVAGLAERVIGRIDNARKFADRNLLNSRPILLFGPPGTGKTSFPQMIHRETAGRSVYAAVNLAPLKADGDPIQMDLLFDDIETQARRLQRDTRKSLIVHFDEIETVIQDRDTLPVTQQAMVNIFNTRLERLKSNYNNVIIIATTNRPESIDKSTLRRFEQMYVGLPNAEQRVQAFIHYIYMAIHRNKDRNKDLFYPELVKIIDDYRDAARILSHKDISREEMQKVAKKYLLLQQVFAACGDASEGFSQDDIRQVVDVVIETHFNNLLASRRDMQRKIDEEDIYRLTMQWANSEHIRRNRKNGEDQYQGGNGNLRIA